MNKSKRHITTPGGAFVLVWVFLSSVGCDGQKNWGFPPSPSAPTVTVELGGRLVNADTGGPVANVRVAVSSVRWRLPNGDGDGSTTNTKETATAGGDGTFTLPLTLPTDWTRVALEFTGPAGYDHMSGRFRAPTADSCGWFPPCWAAADRPAIRMYPTLVIRPGESIEVRVDDTGIEWCGHPLFGDVNAVTCRRVLVAASPGDSVELEVVPHDSSKPMALGFTLRPEDTFLHDPDMSVRSLTVPPGGVPYVLGAGTATLTARR